MPRYHGKAGQVLMAGINTAEASLVVSLSQWTLDMTKDRVEVTSFGDTNRQYVQGFKNIQGTLAGYFDTAEDKMFTATDDEVGVKMYLYPSTNAASRYWYGRAWVDASLDVSATSSVNLSGSFAAAGNWGRN